MLELITFSNVKNRNFLNYSPFCQKVEVFLKLCKIEFKHKEYNGPLKKFPNQKLPVLIDRGVMISDSTFIIEHLIQSRDLKIDSHLSHEQHSVGIVYKSMIEEHLYWAIVCERWLVESNWTEFKKVIFKNVPKPIAFILQRVVRSVTIKNCMGHGFGRLSPQERLKISTSLIQSLSHFISNKTYAFGDKVTSYDAIFHSTISNLLYGDFTPELQREALKHDNLKVYCDNISKIIS